MTRIPWWQSLLVPIALSAEDPHLWCLVFLTVLVARLLLVTIVHLVLVQMALVIIVGRTVLI
jgi:hypothetical protein